MVGIMLKPSAYNLQDIKASLGNLPDPVLKPALIIVSGLPGTGKSYLSRKLSERIPACIVETDAIRKSLWEKPVYDVEESAFLFKICHELVYGLLKQGITVIFDATNLIEYHRERLYNIGERTNAKIIVVATRVPEKVVKRRLDTRKYQTAAIEKSDADWSIYETMKPGMQKIGRNFISANTSGDLTQVINKIIRAISK
jgi:predicted kinase